VKDAEISNKAKVTLIDSAGACIDCSNLAKLTESQGSSMTITLKQTMNALKQYKIQIFNQQTPGVEMYRNQQMTVLTGDGTVYKTINMLGLSQNSFQLEGFKLAEDKAIIKTYDSKNKEQKSFTIYRNVYSANICFGVKRGFPKKGVISYEGKKFHMLPSSLRMDFGEIPN